jgi:hypothetical protein
MKTNKSLLKFDGRYLPYAVIDETVYIAIRPICDAIGVEYSRQYKKVKKDRILSRALYICTMRDPEKKLRKYIALPERYIYGWLFTINTNSDALYEYKVKCHDVLHYYFRGKLAERRQILQEKTKVKIQMSHIRDKLKANEDYQQLNKLQGRHLNLANMLKEIDEEESLKQLELFNG